MSNTTDKHAKNILGTAKNLRFIAILLIVFNTYFIYDLVREKGEVASIMNYALNIISALFIWVLALNLQKFKKQALYYWIVVLVFGLIRWIFIDQTFTSSIGTYLVLGFFAFFTINIFIWIRSGSLK